MMGYASRHGRQTCPGQYLSFWDGIGRSTCSPAMGQLIPISRNRAKRVEEARALAASIFQTGEGWCVSVPGAGKQMRLEILENSRLPDLLAERYRMTREGVSQRMVHNAIELLDANGVRATHPGLVTVTVWLLELP